MVGFPDTALFAILGSVESTLKYSSSTSVVHHADEAAVCVRLAAHYYKRCGVTEKHIETYVHFIPGKISDSFYLVIIMDLFGHFGPLPR